MDETLIQFIIANIMLEQSGYTVLCISAGEAMECVEIVDNTWKQCVRLVEELPFIRCRPTPWYQG